MTITREQLEKAAKAAGHEGTHWFGDGLGSPEVLMNEFGEELSFLTDRGHLLDLAMACRICIDPRLNQIKWLNHAKGNIGDGYVIRCSSVNCQDFPALAEAVILAVCEQFDAKGGGLF